MKNVQKIGMTALAVIVGLVVFTMLGLDSKTPRIF